jgi:hypothetical protein
MKVRILEKSMEQELENARQIGLVRGDSGKIEFGNCGKVHLSISATTGDGIYPVYMTDDNYIVIDTDLLRVTKRENAQVIQVQSSSVD